MSKTESETKILLDADVIRHFIKGALQLHLPKIFPKRFAIIDIVKQELCRSTGLQNPVDVFIRSMKIEEIEFSICSYDIRKEYALLKKHGLGDGESACLALARYDKHYIASSNLRDIKEYCESNGIIYYTTMDLLVEGLRKGIFSEKQCDDFIQTVRARGSKLPDTTIKRYMKDKKK